MYVCIEVSVFVVYRITNGALGLGPGGAGLWNPPPVDKGTVLVEAM